jgi:Flp pilus assembly protein protease CpaA
MDIQVVILIELGLLTAVAAAVDWRTRHIPNQLCWVGAIAGALLHGLAFFSAQALPGAPLPALLGRAGFEIVSGLAVCAVGPLILFYIDAMGGGDVKLLGAIGATAGPALGLQIELWAFILVGLYAPLRLAYEGRLSSLIASTAALLASPRRRSRPRTLSEAPLAALPLAPSIFLATLLVAVASRWQP